ncbi:MAG TPA: PAS domain S-box protein [Burkholderiaceae bacterium]|nr:PAS domain S-box protein [Burkholderiaceae bacterium]
MDRSKHKGAEVDLRKAETRCRAFEERFRALVQFSFDVYWETDADHRFTRQEFAEGLANAPARGSEIGKTRWEVPYLEPDEEAWRQHRATLDAHLPFRDFELARPTADGGRRYVSVSGFPVFDEAGRFVGYRGVGRDITAQKRSQDEHGAHVWFLESMDRINRAMQGIHDLEQMLSEVLDATLQIFACDRAWLVYPCDPGAPSWHVVMERTRPEFPGAFVTRTQFPIDAEVAGVFAAARDAPGAVLFGAGGQFKLPAQVADLFAIRSQLAMAIDPRVDRPYLFGLHQCSHVRDWTADEQRLFQEIGRRLVDALTSLLMFRTLRDSERRLEATQRVARIGWWERDFTTSRVSLSDEACRIFGVPPVDLPQWHDRWLSLIHPEDRAKAAAASEAALRGGPRYDVEYRVVRPDSTVRVVHSQGDVTWDESGQPLRQFGVIQDITDLRLAENELRASEARFRTFVDHARDGFFLMDEQVTVVDVNQQACESLGYSREELIGMQPRDFDAGLDATSIARLAQRAGAGETLTFETLHRRKDGTVFPVEIRSHAFEQGGRQFYLALVRDISERKRAEEELQATEARFRTFAEFAADAFMLHREDGTVIDVNRQACEALGYTRDELIGMTPADFDADLDPEAVRRVAARVGEGETITIETHHRRKDGTVFPVEVRGRQVRHGERWFGISVSRDITERKRSEEEREKLRRLEADLARMNRVTTMGELTASIAHEVNQPLAAMVANAAACERWLSAKPPEKQKALKVLKSIADDGRRASDVIGRIRALMKRQAPRKDSLDINEAIHEVIELAHEQMRRHDVVLETRLAAGLPSVQGDKVQLQQVLLNLIVNAIEAMSGIGDRPRALSIVSAQDGPNLVAVEVRDSGTGLDAEHAERLFDAFYTTKAEGMGIGLAISRSIIEAHGGRLSAAPNAPHGAVFRFSLPVSA